MNAPAPGSGDGSQPAVPAGGNGSASLAQIMLVGPDREPAGRGLRRLTGGQPLAPLLIMFALAFFPFADRATVLVLEEQIHHTLGLNDIGLIALEILTIHLGVILAVPLSAGADRGVRVRRMRSGAVVFTVCSFATAFSPDIWWAFFLIRAATAVGVATVVSSHLSLLADYYGIAHRAKVYALHSVGDGPRHCRRLRGGTQLGEADWRVPYLFIAPPTLIFVVLAHRLHEPERGIHERAAMGVTGEALSSPEDPPTFEEAQRMMRRIESLRRLFFAMPFLGCRARSGSPPSPPRSTSASSGWRSPRRGGSKQVAETRPAARRRPRRRHRHPPGAPRPGAGRSGSSSSRRPSPPLFVVVLAAAPTVPVATRRPLRPQRHGRRRPAHRVRRALAGRARPGPVARASPRPWSTSCRA